jgi:hypothetical protein
VVKKTSRNGKQMIPSLAVNAPLETPVQAWAPPAASVAPQPEVAAAACVEDMVAEHPAELVAEAVACKNVVGRQRRRKIDT